MPTINLPKIKIPTRKDSEKLLKLGGVTGAVAAALAFPVISRR